MPVEVYEGLIPKKSLDALRILYTERIERLEARIKESPENCAIYKAKLEIYTAVSWDLQTLDTRI